jgi:hypothetical protein
MGDFFGGLRSGIQFPQVVMNQGPLPGAGGLPTPLHDTPDARINYGSSLLGNLTPYAYGEPGYLSSQNAYLNIPHKIQKIVPVVYLPEAKSPATDIVDLSHPIDDGDIAFVVRLNRNSMFCTGLKNSSMRRAGLGTAIDPFINLCTLNYILSGMQLGVNGNDSSNLWLELLENMDKARFGRQAGAGRDYATDPLNLNDIIHVVRHCIRPFGITRGSEKQGGQDEATISPATWPVSFVVSLTIDGKESNVLNIWHNHDMSAGEDLVLRLKPMPIRPYTLNHYYKGVKRQTWDPAHFPRDRTHVWQLVPDLLTLEDMTKKEDLAEFVKAVAGMPASFKTINFHNTSPYHNFNAVVLEKTYFWQELGFWHIGRSQIMTGKYGTEEYWHNDLANSLRTNHLDITFQPVFQACQFSLFDNSLFSPENLQAEQTQPSSGPSRLGWQPTLQLERLASEDHSWPAAPSHTDHSWPPAPSLTDDSWPPSLAVHEQPAAPMERIQPVAEEEPDWLGRLEFADEDPPAVPVVEEPPAKKPATGAAAGGKAAGKRKAIGGSLLKADGTSEPSMVGML